MVIVQNVDGLSKLVESQIEKMLVVSTKHIKRSTNDWLEDSAQSGDFLVVHRLKYNFLIPVDEAYLHAEVLSELPGELACLLQLSHSLGCQWLNIDCDGQEISFLPQFDW